MDVEVEALGSARPGLNGPKAETGAKVEGAYVEFDLPDNAIMESPPRGERNTARIPTNNQALPLEEMNPTFVHAPWWKRLWWGLTCMVCHSRAANFVLGLNVLQMNRQHSYGTTTDNQLKVPQQLSVFTDDTLPGNPQDHSQLVNPYDDREDLSARARSYLHANCSQCHVVAGGGNSRSTWNSPPNWLARN